ncbi:unnamed protein product [Caenorhabditis bovis]|uniref:Signal peptidase complex subunit 3 n=1 Tax=Caenorhabditis bovis TaxID=2654633 RepID=A0A8S1EP02_9PELO|nr:unnamed protein product [Caenorhabditis bovis]
MHSLLNRANALLAFTLWVLAAVTAACFLSAVFEDYTTDVSYDVKNLKVRSIVDYASDEQVADVATMKISFKADFTKVFNWNVKQLFVFLVAEYSTPKNEVNQIILWDRIVERNNRVVMDERELRTKYYCMDDGRHLLGHNNVTLILRYNVVPNAGYLRLSQARQSVSLKLPTEYASK